jgi:exodeoxyribonuclease V alpha subunit
MNIEELNLLLNCDYIGHIDRHFAKFISGLCGGENNILILSAALVSRVSRDGHTCLDINNYAGKKLSDFTSIASDVNEAESGNNIIALPKKEEWLAALRSSPVISISDEIQPLVLSGERLYLKRFYDYQKVIAEKIKELGSEISDVKIGKNIIARYFTDEDQLNAAQKALESGFVVITGGPGTGKTTTVTKILILLLQNSDEKEIKIHLAAPTGKAADRMVQSVEKSLNELSCPEEIKSKVPRKASTLHRLLGAGKDARQFRYGKDNKLDLDVLIVDEASMIDSAMMARLCDALPEKSKVILLGDSDQLSSVEPGSVLADICSEEKYVAQLSKSYRFDGNSLIKKLSNEINAGRADYALELIKAAGTGDGVLLLPPAELFNIIKSNSAKTECLAEEIMKGYTPFLLAKDAEEKFKSLERFIVLCVLREGPYGVNRINEFAEELFKQKKLLKPKGDWYEGLPVMITKNDHSLGLYNGDVGIVMRSAGAGENNDSIDLKAWFRDGKGGYKKISRFILPEYEKVFAMTVHKSQGSEFDTVVVVLPELKKNVTMLTRELLYTAITRAKKTVKIFSSETAFLNAVRNRTLRSSGLADKLSSND